MSKNSKEIDLIVGFLADYLVNSGIGSHKEPTNTQHGAPGNSQQAAVKPKQGSNNSSPKTGFTPSFNALPELTNLNLNEVYSDEELFALVGASADQIVAAGFNPTNSTY